MKELRINLPTSFAEVRAMLKERTDRRYRHNRAVLAEFGRSVNRLANSGYWSNDISMAMKSTAFGLTSSSELGKMLNEALSKLK